MSFADTPNKRAIRRIWDMAILARWQQRVGHPLTYLGLTGPKLLDLQDWRQVLSRERTTVESVGRTSEQRRQAKELISDMRVNASNIDPDFDSGLQICEGDIEQVILKGIDLNGNPPQVNDRLDARSMRFGYDLVNLDFDGGLGVRLGRADALKKLFERQAGRDSILFLTLNVRSKLRKAISTELEGLRGEYDDPHWQELVDWHAREARGLEPCRLKAVVPSLIREYARIRSLASSAYPPVVYEGHEHARLVHFAFELTTQPETFRAHPAQRERHLLSLPMMESVDGELRFASDQPPGVAPQASLLDFLGAEQREAIVRRALHQVGSTPRSRPAAAAAAVAQQATTGRVARPTAQPQRAS